MARRGSENSPEDSFGSDSFLDVVANIVGILIILIVLVGLRIKQAPPRQHDSANQGFTDSVRAWQEEKQLIESANMEVIAAQEEAEAHARRERERRLEDLRHRQAVQDRRLEVNREEVERRLKLLQQYKDEAANLQAELDRLAQEETKAAEKRATAKSNEQTKERERQQKETQWASLKEEEAGASLALVDLKKQGESLRARLLELQKVVKEESEKGAVTKKIVHYGTPMARRISQDELHFRVKNGRIAFTHLEELLEAAKEQSRARLSASTSRLDGVTPAIGGFRLQYVVSRPGGSMAEQLSGMGMMQYALVYWELSSESDLIGETADDALAGNSALRVKLRSAPPSKFAVTLWVYPDGFKTAKAVETLLHESGYVVSLRPLPIGIPIIGSPLGSSSYSH